MNSNYIKTILGQFFRYQQSCTTFASEAGFFNSDFLCEKKGMVYEIEIKTSKSDLSNDFKKPKHKYYRALYSRVMPHIPNFFYFAVPPEMVDFALRKVEGTKYGVVEILPEDATKKSDDRYVLEKHLVDDAIQQLHEKNIKVLGKSEYHDVTIVRFEIDVPKPYQDRVRIVKRAVKLHKNTIHESMRYQILKRASSELAKLKLENYLLKNKLNK